MNSSKNYEKVKFVNLSIISLGVFSHSSLDFTKMLKDPKFDEQCRKYYVRKIINICIRSSYYIFCKRNKEWDNPFYIYIIYILLKVIIQFPLLLLYYIIIIIIIIVSAKYGWLRIYWIWPLYSLSQWVELTSTHWRSEIISRHD
jgi:hypothetical protein